jgi:protein phosphatase 1 regulatory subunit 12A
MPQLVLVIWKYASRRILRQLLRFLAFFYQIFFVKLKRFLVSKGARLNICNNDSDLPIDLCDSSNLQMKEFLDNEMRIQCIDPEFEKQKEELIMYEDAKEMKFSDKIHAKTGATPLHVSSAKGYTRVMK